MKKLRALLVVTALALLGWRADAATIMSAQSTNGYGSAWATVTTDDPTAHWTVLGTCVTSTGAPADGCGVVIEISLDSGTTFSPYRRLRGPSDQFDIPSCGTCIIRANGFSLDAEHKATVQVLAGGALTPAFPTYTPTKTPTVTPTAKNTATRTPTPTSPLVWPTLTPQPTASPTRTPTVTPTKTPTKTPSPTRTQYTPTSTATPTHTPTLTNTPTATTTPPTATPTPTATKTPTLTPTNRFVGP